MIVKHPKTARLRKLRPVFFQVGLLLALGVTLGAFKWTTYGDNVDVVTYEGKLEESTGIRAINIIDEHKKEVVKVEKQKKLTPPNPDEMNLVNNETIVDTNVYEQKPDTYLEGLMASKPKNPFGGPPAFKEDPDPVMWAPKMPSYPGGDDALAKFVQKHMIVPYDVKMNARQSITIYTEVVVEKDGRLSEIKVVKDGGYPSAGEAAQKVIESMPKWNPGFQDIWPVRVRVVIPIKIKMER
jgi:protein TonB